MARKVIFTAVLLWRRLIKFLAIASDTVAAGIHACKRSKWNTKKTFPNV